MNVLVYHAKNIVLNYKSNHLISQQSGNQTVSHSSLKHSFSEMKCVAVDPVYILNNVLQKMFPKMCFCWTDRSYIKRLLHQYEYIVVSHSVHYKVCFLFF